MSDSTYQFSMSPVLIPKVETINRKICTSLPVPESLPILEKIIQYESSNVRDQLPIVWDRASGFQIYDRWGNCWIDFTSTIFVANAGHGHPKLIDAINRQSQKLLHAYSYATEIRASYLEKLISIVPNYLTKASLYSSGTEAAERAVKLIRYYGKRDGVKSKKVIVGWDGNYHGKTMGSQMMGGQHKDKDWIGFMDPNIVHLPFPYPWVLEKEGVSGGQLFHRHLQLLSNSGVEFENIAGFMAETFQGWAAVFYPTDYILELRKWSSERDILLAFDEIQAGFGRCGKLFGFEHYGVEPDLVCCGKGISGSFPLSAVIGRGDIIDLDPAYTSTHGGHPIACAAGLANLQIFEDENLIVESERKGILMSKILQSWQTKFPERIGLIFGKGLLYGVFIKKKNALDFLDLDIEFCDRLVEKAMQKGVFCIRTGRGTLKFGPPLSIPDDALVEGLSAIEESLSELM